MDNQNQTPTPQPQMATAAPMPEPQPQPAQPPQTPKGSKLLWIIMAIVVLFLTGGAYYYFIMNKAGTGLSAYPSPTVIPTSTEPTEIPAPTVNPIESSSDLDGALNQIDTTNPSVGTELDQNTSDSTTFTP